MKTAVLNSFLKIYVMGSPGIDFFGIAHVKVGFIPVLKMYAIPMLEIFGLNYRICTMCALSFPLNDMKRPVLCDVLWDSVFISRLWLH